MPVYELISIGVTVSFWCVVYLIYKKDE